MPSESLIRAHRSVQNAAKSVLEKLGTQISETDTEESIAAIAHQALRVLGIPDTSYYDCPAYVLSGTRSCQSISGIGAIAPTRSSSRTAK